MELMKAYGSSAAPRSYEVWYTYVGGQKPLMNDAIKRLSVERGNVSDEDIASIYDAIWQPTVTSSRPRRPAPR